MGQILAQLISGNLAPFELKDSGLENTITALVDYFGIGIEYTSVSVVNKGSWPDTHYKRYYISKKSMKDAKALLMNSHE